MTTDSSGDAGSASESKPGGEGARASEDLKRGFREGSADDVGEAAERLGSRAAEHAGEFVDEQVARAERAPGRLRARASELKSAASPGVEESSRLRSEAAGIKSSLASIREDASAVAGEARRQADEARSSAGSEEE